METLPRILLPAMWLTWIAYWAISARNAKPTIRRESLASRLSYHVPLAVGALLIALPHLPVGVLNNFFLPRTAAEQWLGVALAATGLGFSALARATLGSNWSSDVTVKQEHELVRSGPYAWVRHPIYTGLLLALAGATLTVDRWRALIGLALMTAGLLRKLSIEERFMRDWFGEAYARYSAEVPALIPLPGRSVRR